MKRYCSALICLIVLSSIVAPALGISISYSSGNGGKAVSSSTAYDLDDSTSLQEQAVLGESGISQSREAAGSGKNRINQMVSGNGYSANNLIDSTGSFSASTSAVASDSGAGVSQSVGGNGDLKAAVSSTAGSSASSQAAGVSNGELSTKQSLVAGGSVYAGQSTSLNGDAGSIASTSSSPENEMAVTSGFSGTGDLSADLGALASGRAAVDGGVSLLGVPCLDNSNLQAASSGDVAMSLDGLFVQPNGKLGDFGVSTVNMEKKSGGNAGGGTPLYQLPENNDPYGGRKEAYLLTGWRWNQRDPQIKFYLKDDSNLKNEKLDPAAVKTALEAAANTWDAATNQNLFSDTGVTVSTAVNSDIYDRKNVAAWKYLSSAPSALAYSRTWYSYSKVGGYYSAVESDLSFNTRYAWSTTGKDGTPNYYGNPIDVQSVALHELGHTIGLGDLYGKSQYASDTRQSMHYYDRVKRTLGNGDKTGAWLLYG